MNPSTLLKSLNSSGASPTTTIVLWAMIIFLIILIIGLSASFIKQIKTRETPQKEQPSTKKPQGF